WLSSFSLSLRRHHQTPHPFPTRRSSDLEGAKKNFSARKYELQTRLADTDVIPDVRSGVNSLLNGGQSLLDKVLDNGIGRRERIRSEEHTSELQSLTNLV